MLAGLIYSYAFHISRARISYFCHLGSQDRSRQEYGRQWFLFVFLYTFWGIVDLDSFFCERRMSNNPLGALRLRSQASEMST